MSSKTGFTLIELLVVVLIIGVLAFVALPQYRLAVAKARLADFALQSRALRDSLRMFYLANGSAARRVSDLDLWNSIRAQSSGSECGTLGKQEYCDVGGHYIRTLVKLPGYRTWTCDFHWAGTIGFCYVYTADGAKLAQNLGWQRYGSDTAYHIGENWNKK